MLDGVVPTDYDALCRQWSDDQAAGEGWKELRVALGGRSGWWFLDPRQLEGFDGGPMWCFGQRSQAKLCVTPFGQGFEIYDTDADQEMSFDLIGDLVAWIDDHEPDADLSPMLQQFLDPGTDPRRR